MLVAQNSLGSVCPVPLTVRGSGCAVVHRQGTVLHAGGAVTAGTKHIMQFFLYYEEKPEPEPRHMTNLRWGA